MKRTRGPAVYGKLFMPDKYGELYEEDGLAWTWAKKMMRGRFPRCSFKQNPHAVIAFKHGEPVALWLKATDGEKVRL